MQDAEVIRLQIPGTTEYIAIARRAIDAVGEQICLSASARAEVKLAVGEACNNAAMYAKEDGFMVVACRIHPDSLEIEVTNQGNGFHPEDKAAMPQAEEMREHGRGLALMELIMDSVEYLTENGNTTVRLRKKRPLTIPAP